MNGHIRPRIHGKCELATNRDFSLKPPVCYQGGKWFRMALSFEVPNEHDSAIKLNSDDPRMPLLRQQERQQAKRLRKIRKGTRGKQHNWLLWWVKPSDSIEEFEDWLLSNLSSQVGILPESVYKVAIESLLNREIDIAPPTNGPFVWSIDEKHRIAALPEMGVIAFFAPPGNLRKAIDPKNLKTSWNWSFAGSPFSDKQEFVGTGEGFKRPDYVEKLHEKFGRGEKAVIGILDSGIDPDCSELEGRILATWAITDVPNSAPRPDYNRNTDEIGHGTETATIAAGTKHGIADKAKIVSLKLPMRWDGSSYRYRLLDLVTAFSTLQSDAAPAIEGKPVLSLIDTLLLPNGIRLSGRWRTDTNIANIVDAVARFNSVHDVVVIAAIGNKAQSASFPATEANVLSVGALDLDGKRWDNSGWSVGSTGQTIPVIHFPGCDIECLSLNGKAKRCTGTSMAAAGVAGVVALLAQKSPTSLGRWQIVRNNLAEDEDQFGPLPKFSI